MRTKLLPLLSLALLLAACGGSSGYHYPSVQLEYLTATSGADGSLQSILNDEGDTYTVVTDASGTTTAADTTLRIVANYAMVDEDEAGSGVKLYSVRTTFSSLPVPSDRLEQIVTDPADVLSIWMGLDYLNIVLAVKAQDGTHTFGFVEQSVSTDTAEGSKVVSLLLYHDMGDDIAAYTQRVYLSVPLRQYAESGITAVTVHFSLYTDTDTLETYTFDYKPS